MRQKTPKIVVTFSTTNDAMAVEAFARETNLPGRMIPVPSAVAAGCGLAWCVAAAARDELVSALDERALAYECLHVVDLY